MALVDGLALVLYETFTHTDSPFRRSAGLCLGSCREVMVYGRLCGVFELCQVVVRIVRRIKKTSGFGENRTRVKSSMRCVAAGIDGWQGLDGAGVGAATQIRGKAATT